MMKKNPDQTVVGFFVIVAFVLLSVMVFFISGVYLFRPGYSLFVNYDYVSILDKGAPVRMAGVRIGEVNQVELRYQEETGKTRVRIKLFIEKGIDIRKNYEFNIQGTHILSEPHIEITPKVGGAPVLLDGSEVEGAALVPIENLIASAHKIAENLESFSGDLKDIFSDDGSNQALKNILVNLSKVTESLDKVLNGSENNLQEAIQNLGKSTDSLKDILDHMEKGEGTVGGLLMKDEIYNDMKDLVADIKAHPWKLLKKGSTGEKKEKKFLFF